MKTTSTRRRLLALLLAVVMLVGLLPTSAFADTSSGYYMISDWANRIGRSYGESMDPTKRFSFVKEALSEGALKTGCALGIPHADGSEVYRSGKYIVGLYNTDDKSLVIKSGDTIILPQKCCDFNCEATAFCCGTFFTAPPSITLFTEKTKPW